MRRGCVLARSGRLRAARAALRALRRVRCYADGYSPMRLRRFVPSFSRVPEIRFAQVVFIVCLFLQRFAFPAGGDLKISVATPLISGYAGLGLSSWLGLDRRRLAYFLALCSVAILAYCAQVSLPSAIAPRSSLNSLAYWLLVTGFGVLSFRRRVNENEFFRAIMPVFMIVAAAGLLQFLLQFVGISAFSFSDYVPERFLNEELYAVVNHMEYGGDVIRSNGFFLIEASVFSQVMAVGIIIEYMRFRRPGVLALMAAGLFVSVSGTGWLVLGAFILIYGVTSGARGLRTAITLGLACVLSFIVASVAYPPIADMLVGRLGEFGMQGTSGNERFVTPILAMNFVFDWEPYAFWTGIGPGASEHLINFSEKYVLNTPIKVLLEYGIFGLGFYMLFLLSAVRNGTQRALVGPLLILLLFAGGYHNFSPMLFPMLLLMNVASLSDLPGEFRGQVSKASLAAAISRAGV